MSDNHSWLSICGHLIASQTAVDMHGLMNKCFLNGLQFWRARFYIQCFGGWNRRTNSTTFTTKSKLLCLTVLLYIHYRSHGCQIWYDQHIIGTNLLYIYKIDYAKWGPIIFNLPMYVLLVQVLCKRLLPIVPHVFMHMLYINIVQTIPDIYVYQCHDYTYSRIWKWMMTIIASTKINEQHSFLTVYLIDPQTAVNMQLALYCNDWVLLKVFNCDHSKALS